LLGGSESEEEGSNPATSQYPPSHIEGASKLGLEKIQGVFGFPHPSTPLAPHPPPPPHKSPTPPPPPPPPSPLRRKMVNDIKVPIFKGLGSEDPDQFWFVADAV